VQNSMSHHGPGGVKDPVSGVREKPANYSAELEARTQDYIQQLLDIETKCSQPGADPEKLQAEITAITDRMIEACAEFEQKVNDPFKIKAAQVIFRERTNAILGKSYCINRTRNWPQGHQGDYSTLEMAYKNTPLSYGLGFYLDRYLLSDVLTEGVRDRIVKLRDLVRMELSVRRNPRVLDVACGSCREVFELAQDIKASGAKFICVDLDEDALDYALDRLTLAGLSEEDVELRKYNALRIFDFETALTEFGMQDVIYSVGYFDYLPDDFLVKLLNSLYKLLAPGGKLIASFKDANRYRPHVFHWLVNWDGFLQRTETDFERLFNCTEIPAQALTVERVKSGAVLFYSALKV
jgi:extracellular factor (EF) 3-hydroxypalmitic acid methyl ester biosynthesis protein